MLNASVKMIHHNPIVNGVANQNRLSVDFATPQLIAPIAEAYNKKCYCSKLGVKSCHFILTDQSSRAIKNVHSISFYFFIEIINIKLYIPSYQTTFSADWFENNTFCANKFKIVSYRSFMEYSTFSSIFKLTRMK